MARFRWLLFLMAVGSFAQTPLPTQIGQTRFSTGQDVQPVFEGWLRNSDGTFTMVFGYLNRNYKEELAIPAGPDNKVEPGGPDQGQPTFFLPRRQSFLFRVQVPKDWDPQKELIWTVTAHGRTEKAFGQLLPEEEITERMIMTRGNLSLGEDDPNQPPVIKIFPVADVVVSSPVTLTAFVTDDGLPKPRTPRPGDVPGQSNGVERRARGGLTVAWVEYRGPAKVTFESTPVVGGKAVTTAHFVEPGIYVLGAIASDGALSTRADVKITVKEPSFHFTPPKD